MAAYLRDTGCPASPGSQDNPRPPQGRADSRGSTRPSVGGDWANSPPRRSQPRLARPGGFFVRPVQAPVRHPVASPRTSYLPATRFLAWAASVSMAKTFRYAAGSCPSRSAIRKTVILILSADDVFKYSGRINDLSAFGPKLVTVF
jgi:hypothetical protein